ncbi:AAA family ATPase [Methylocapsa sp. D3K7]|uniref:AAA family ATPase n=1 Tax=Methylocapsa sp. D3K7 TaxID=3041435 RepID=UPI00244EAF90|nr:AAA family ATPase [Methylocapsa sp. D3K7]WGJ15657.1 AAA family ATPase [Methylocapsa sp. D3K7]
MALSNEMRRLETKWQTGNGWPKWLEWLQIQRIRGWSDQRITFDFPIVAIVGENGSGKSTVLQSAACVYQNQEQGGVTWFPSEFFPETAWDNLSDVRLTFGYKQGVEHNVSSVRKPTTRWLGQPERPERRVAYIDLSRLQPVSTRVGYARIAKNKHLEQSATPFTDDQVSRLSQIMGRDYDNARMAISTIDASREIPVLSKANQPYSGFHQGSGETTVAELLGTPLPQYGLILIDEIESSLHPRAQRRLIRDLAVAARDRECQIIVSTHSPYILEELPLSARIYILETGRTKEIVNGVSPQFAMTKMDDEQHPECELYVEDGRAAVFLSEILSRHARELFVRCSIIPYGAANLGVALGQMVQANRFPRPTRVFLDGDQGAAVGCLLLPGGDAPERVVFEKLQREKWRHLWTRIGRDIALVSDACERAMTLADHHEWIRSAANQLMCGGDVLWQAMCCEWAEVTLVRDVQYIADSVGDALA